MVWSYRLWQPQVRCCDKNPVNLGWLKRTNQLVEYHRIIYLPRAVNQFCPSTGTEPSFLFVVIFLLVWKAFLCFIRRFTDCLFGESFAFDEESSWVALCVHVFSECWLMLYLLVDGSSQKFKIFLMSLQQSIGESTLKPTLQRSKHTVTMCRVPVS